jgi:hypothetical protein
MRKRFQSAAKTSLFAPEFPRENAPPSQRAPMSPAECLRHLRAIRFSSKRARPIPLAFVAHQSGYSPRALYSACVRGWLTQIMANHLSAVFQKYASLSREEIALINNKLGRPRKPGPRWPCGKLKRPPHLVGQERDILHPDARTADETSAK